MFDIVNMRMRFVCFFVLLLPFNSISQSRERVTQPTQWVLVAANLKFSDRISGLVETQFRQIDRFDPMQYQFRTGVDVKLTDHWSVMPLAYVYTWNTQYGKQPAAFVNHEHRIWQQIMYKHAVGRIQWQHRARLEQRFIQRHSIEDGESVYHGYDHYLNRFRYRMMLTVPLGGKKIIPNSYFLSAFDEFFVSWGNGITYHKPDQNRIFVGVGYQFKQPFSVQLGGFHHILLKANATKQETNIGGMLQVNVNLDFTKGV
jgi:hypothetical protein